MKPEAWPSLAPEVAYFVDLAGTWFAAEVVRAPRWSSDLLEAPDVEVADIRIVFLDRPVIPSVVRVPEWLAVLARDDEVLPAVVVSAALRAWQQSLHFRPAGPAPEEYTRAGFGALCPPHPPCEVGHTARESLQEFLRDRPGALGRLASDGRDAFNRLVRVHWATPAGFAEAVLCERIVDEGRRSVLDVMHRLREAHIQPGTAEYASMAVQREALLRRLEPVRYFTEARDFDEALECAAPWLEQYERAALAHHRVVDEAIGMVLLEIGPAVSALRELRMLNLSGRAVGSDAADRLDIAVASLLPHPDERSPAGSVLGLMPAGLEEARSAAAAVLAAVEVHRRRGVSSPSRARG